MERRRRAAALFADGVSRAEAARRLGVSRATATRWHRDWRAGHLLVAARRGRRPRLVPGELARVDRALVRGPRASGFALDRWTLAAVAALVERLTGARYHRRHMGRLLRRMGWVIPPVGPAAPHAFRHRLLHDPDGNLVSLRDPLG